MEASPQVKTISGGLVRPSRRLSRIREQGSDVKSRRTLEEGKCEGREDDRGGTGRMGNESFKKGSHQKGEKWTLGNEASRGRKMMRG